MIRAKKIQSLSDEQLVSLFQQKGNQKYMGELYNRYAHLVYGVCLKYLKNPEEAQDTLMLIFEKLLQNLSKYNIEKFKPWLYQLSKNECLMKLRKNKKVTKLNMEDTQLEHDDTALLEKKQQEKDFIALEKAITQLKPKQQECVKLFYLKKYSYQQIESQTNYNLKEIKSAIQNGKRNLKIILEQQQSQ